MKKNKYRVKITPIAYEDLDDIYTYIVNDLDNDITAEKLMNDK